MVHALQEIWRVLAAGGLLLDLRPVHAAWPLEVVTNGHIIPVASVHDSASVPDDRAANTAIEQAVQEGWFVQEQKQTFDYAWYWDSTSELKAYYESKSPPIHVPEAALARAQQLLHDSSDPARVRVHAGMMLARYRKTAR